MKKPWLILVLPLLSCGGGNTNSNVKADGSEKTSRDKILGVGAKIIQAKQPLQAFNTYLNGFHFYNGNINAQMEAHHYTAQLNEDLYQAIIFDGNGADAKIMGVEYIITEKLFKQLSMQEKLLWHSHVYEVKSGELIAPGLPDAAEHELMKKLATTYGKTIHTWHTDQNLTLPVGSPMLMMGFTKDGQINKRLLTERDKRLKVSTRKKRERRKDIPSQKAMAGANAWQEGQIRQFVISNKPDSAMHKHTQ
ncbi:DUF1264 domain-containing protein [Mucilaginibacter limnophilus]|uniref:DUF1264 domain-containing protein n=1 Tax=Mucilaginibacter limnophilus TaxID=1932778 RepID=A0A437MXU4_9SPHI|nr:OBAP family protein [Mucilaginibacter limnophilus]RVU02478.1 DUF1264 domain-containing protein [Mucilaginibacter limnophilus]